jgi:hypothetical protein
MVGIAFVVLAKREIAELPISFNGTPCARLSSVRGLKIEETDESKYTRGSK